MNTSKALAVTLFLLVLSSLATVYLALENHRQKQVLLELNARLADVDTESGKSRASFEKKEIQIRRIPRYTLQEVTCPLCNGTGELQWKQSRRDEDGYPCPLCKTEGTNIVQVGRGGALCPDCDGMGLLPVAPGNDSEKYFARICTRCNGRGWRKVKP